MFEKKLKITLLTAITKHLGNNTRGLLFFTIFNCFGIKSILLLLGSFQFKAKLRFCMLLAYNFRTKGNPIH